MRRLDHRALGEIARRLRHHAGYRRDVEFRLTRLANQRAERRRCALAVSARYVEREFGGIARGADLEHVAWNHASAVFQRFDRNDVTVQALEARAQISLRVAGAEKIEISDRRIEDDLRARRRHPEPRRLEYVF